MNGLRTVNIGKMVGMEAQRPVRQIDSAEELRALAPPIRVAILSALDRQSRAVSSLSHP